VSGQLHAPAALPPGKEPLVPTGKEAGWTPLYIYMCVCVCERERDKERLLGCAFTCIPLSDKPRYCSLDHTVPKLHVYYFTHVNLFDHGSV
jgi:hypothetical protein